MPCTISAGEHFFIKFNWVNSYSINGQMVEKMCETAFSWTNTSIAAIISLELGSLNDNRKNQMTSVYHGVLCASALSNQKFRLSYTELLTIAQFMCV